MSCPNLNDNDFKITVIAVVKTYHPGHSIDEDTDFETDLGEDGITRRKYWGLIRKDILDDGCQLAGGPGDLDNCATVRDMIGVVKKNTSC